jgi:signal transduction histidine kinase
MRKLSVYREGLRAKHGEMSASILFHSQPKWALLAESLLLLLLIGLVDRQTGWELSMFAFYAVPIFMAVWFVSRSSGLLVAAVGAVVWWIANRTEHPYQTEWGYNVATVSRMVYFSFVAIGAAALKSQRDADRARIHVFERTRQLEEEIVRVSEHEQQRIGRDLHDGLCQYLAAIGLSAKSFADDLDADASPRAKEAREIVSSIKDAVAQARSLARAVFPVQMDGAGLSIALDELAATTKHLTSMNVTFKESGDTRVSNPTIATQLFRIAQEALSNSMKHSEAKHIVISLSRQNGILELDVIDNGRGFVDEPHSGRRLGLGTMNYRARSIGAELKIESAPGKGTTVKCKLPLPSPSGDSTDHG